MRRALIAGLALFLMTGLAGCSGGTRTAEPGDSPVSQSPSPSPTSLADAKALATLSNGRLAIDVLSVQHVTDTMAIARFRLRNTSDDRTAHLTPYGSPNWSSPDYAVYKWWNVAFSREYLIDLQAGHKYFAPKSADTGKCLCTNFDSAPVTLAPGGTPTYAWAAYPLPTTVSGVAVRDLQFGLTETVPVSDSGAQLPQVEGEPGPGELARDGGDPTTLEFRSDSPARHAHNKGDTVTVNVSSDVLFEFDSARLSAKAGAQLDQVASRIKTETDGPVNITGYTDSKGSTSYNVKLSKNRARAVEKALDKRLDKDVTFKVRGKGETDPIAPNIKNGQDNPAGRKKNRRVEISYERTVQRGNTSSPTANSTEPTPAGRIGKPIPGTAPYTNGLSVQVNDLRRLTRGVLLTFTVHNNASESVDLDQWLRAPDSYASGYAGHYHSNEVFWVNLEDSTQTRYWVVADTQSHCVCSTYLGELAPGGQWKLWAVLTAPPAGTDTVDVHFNGYGTLHDVPISS